MGTLHTPQREAAKKPSEQLGRKVHLIFFNLFVSVFAALFISVQAAASKCKEISLGGLPALSLMKVIEQLWQVMHWISSHTLSDVAALYIKGYRRNTWSHGQKCKGPHRAAP